MPAAAKVSSPAQVSTSGRDAGDEANMQPPLVQANLKLAGSDAVAEGTVVGKLGVDPQRTQPRRWMEPPSEKPPPPPPWLAAILAAGPQTDDAGACGAAVAPSASTRSAGSGSATDASTVAASSVVTMIESMDMFEEKSEASSPSSRGHGTAAIVALSMSEERSEASNGECPAVFALDTSEDASSTDVGSEPEYSDGEGNANIRLGPSTVPRQLALSDILSVPRVDGDLLSIGSARHLKLCVACKYHNTARGCRDGMLCTDCHFPHPELSRSRRRRICRQRDLQRVGLGPAEPVGLVAPEGVDADEAGDEAASAGEMVSAEQGLRNEEAALKWLPQHAFLHQQPAQEGVPRSKGPFGWPMPPNSAAKAVGLQPSAEPWRLEPVRLCRADGGDLYVDYQHRWARSNEAVQG
mmetsp:Transcript_106338/g.317817  ORF Transcript_106338/g.317817 Transcript_106338/m.317817 type:complete len:410 (+) Transcript_106338:148-1377(+)